MTNCILSLQSVSKRFQNEGKFVDILKDVSLDFHEGLFYSILGTSGSGKSTILNIISGIESPSSGDIINNSQESIGYLFQDNSILPWKTVYDNISFPLRIKKNKNSFENEVKSICQEINLNYDIHKNKYPNTLSGGERKKVSIGMSLAHKAKLLLLDEPTSQLDFHNKYNIQLLLQKIHFERKLTTILVTHDVDEAILLSDIVVILKDGKFSDLFKINSERPRNYKSLENNSLIRMKEMILSKYE